MKIKPTTLKDCFIISSHWHQDDRGGFMESFNQQEWQKNFPRVHFVQDNEAHSTYGVVRGMHFQSSSFAQAKLVRVICGKIKDIVLDLRPESPTYLQQFSYELSEENKDQLFVPRGFAHGYGVLSKKAIVLYKVDAPYTPKSEAGISPRDPFFQWDWGIPLKDQIINQRDLNWPMWSKK